MDEKYFYYNNYLILPDAALFSLNVGVLAADSQILAAAAHIALLSMVNL